MCIEADDIIKIMLATDNHIGYMERDPVRGQDAINTFKEILELAVKYEASIIVSLLRVRALKTCIGGLRASGRRPLP